MQSSAPSSQQLTQGGDQRGRPFLQDGEEEGSWIQTWERDDCTRPIYSPRQSWLAKFNNPKQKFHIITQRVELHTHVRRAVYLISIYIRTKTYQSTLRKLKSKNHNIILIWWNLLSQNLVNPINSFNVLAKSLNSLKEKQMDDCKHKAALCPSWRRIKIERLDRTSQITFHPNRLKHDRSFYQSRMSRQRKGTSFPQFPSLLIRPTTLHFNGLCRKSMWDRLHRGRKRVWSSTNKHYGQTAAAPKVEISANRLALTLFWENATLLRAVIQKAANVAFLELLCFFVQLYLFCFRYKQLQHFFQQTLTYLSLIFLVH